MTIRKSWKLGLALISFMGVACSDQGNPTIHADLVGPQEPTPKLARSLDSLTLELLEAQVWEDRMPLIVIGPPQPFDRISCEIRFVALNESQSLYFDSLSARVGDVYLETPHSWLGRFTFWSNGIGRLMPGERDTVTLYKTSDPPYSLGSVSVSKEDSIAIFVILQDNHGEVEVLPTQYIPYQIGS